MEERFRWLAGNVALSIEAVAVVLIAAGALEATVLAVSRLAPGAAAHGRLIRRREIWIRLAVWLVLGLEFELAADVIRSSISPSWSEIGQLGAIAAIRTVLNYFLGRDINEFGDMTRTA